MGAAVSDPVRLLAIMGSGETTPTMAKVHRELFDRLAPANVPAVLLDTPYGFQANSQDISARAVAYFREAVGRKVEVASLLRAEGASPVALEAALALVGEARWVFTGPGSPTYALRQWRPTVLPQLLEDKLIHDGCLVFSSAAALTLGRWTVPVYEIYKVGADPVWEEGLDLLGPSASTSPSSPITTTPKAARTTPATATSENHASRPWRPSCRRTPGCSGWTSTPPACST